MSNERINYIKTSDYGITPYLSYCDTNKIRIKFDGSCLKQDQGTLLHGGIVSIYIAYEIPNTFNVSSYPALENCLFGSAKLTKLKTLTLTHMYILVMELDLMDIEVFHFLALD